MATRTISNAGGNFNNVLTWLEGAVPVAGDSVVATATSGQLTVDVASGGVGLLSVDFTGYVNTLTMNATLTVSGNVTLATGMTVAGTSDLIINTTATLTSHGKTFSGGLQFDGNSFTSTLNDNWHINGSITAASLSVQVYSFIGGNTIYIGGGITNVTSELYAINNTDAHFVLNGTGTVTTGYALYVATEINTLGVITLSGTVEFRRMLTYTTGTIISFGTLRLNNGSSFVINKAITLHNFYTSNSSSLVISGTNGFTLTGILTADMPGQTITWQAGNTYTINSTGGLVLTGTSGSHISMVSSSGSVKAILTLTAGATQNVSYINATGIDSSGGQKIIDKGGALTQTINWANGIGNGLMAFFMR